MADSTKLSEREEEISLENNLALDEMFDQDDNLTQNNKFDLQETCDSCVEPRFLKKSSKKTIRSIKMDDELTLSADEQPGTEQYIVGSSGHELYGESRRERKAAIKSRRSEMSKHERLPPPIYKNRVFCCFTSIILLLVLLIGGLLGATVYAYNTYVRPVTEMNLFDALNIISRLYKADADAIITNPYDAAIDSANFYEGLSDSLKIDTILSISDIASGLDILTGDDIVVSEGSTGNPFIDELLTNTEFDFTSLVNFDGTTRPSFAISDKMLAAVLNDLFSISSEIEQLATIEEALGISIPDFFDVNQVIITPYNDSLEHATFNLTLSANIEDFAISTLSEIEEIPAFVLSMLPAFLPDTLFFSFTLTPGIETPPEIQLNNLDETMMSQIIVAMDNILALKSKDTNTDLIGGFTDLLNTVGTEVNRLFQKVNTLVGAGGISFAASENTGGVMNIDTLQAMISVMGMDNVTSTDFLLMIKHLHSVDLSIVEGITIEDYIDALVDNPTSLDIYNAEIESVFSGYGVTADAVADWTPDTFIDKMVTLPGLINIVDFEDENGKHLYEQSQADLSAKAHFSDAALAQIMQAMLSDTSTGGTALPFDIQILELTMIQSPEFSGFKIFASIDITEFLKAEVGSSPILGLILSLFPKNLFVEISTPFEKNPDPTQVSSNIILNISSDSDSDSAAASDAMIDTLSKIITSLESDGPSFNKDTLIKKLDDQIYAAIDSLEGDATSEVPISIGLTDKGIQLPTIYELLIDITAEPDTEPVSPDEMQAILYSFYDMDKFMDGSSYIDNVHNVNLYESSGFVKRELEDKMFLNTAPYIDSTDSNKNVYNYLTTIGANLAGANIDKSVNIPNLVNNNKHAKEGNLAITSLEFAKILLEGDILSAIEESISIYKDFTIIDAMVASDGNMVMTIVGSLAEEIKEPEGGSIGINLSQFATPHIFIKASLPLSKSGNATGEIGLSINSAESNEEMSALLKILSATAGIDISIDSITSSLDIENMLSSFTEQGITLDTVATAETNGIAANNIYDLVASRLGGYVDSSDELKRSDDMLRRILYSLHNPSDFLTHTGVGQGNVIVGDTAPSKPVIDISNLLIANITLDDLFLGHSIANSLKTSDNGSLNVSKLAIFPAGDTAFSAFTKKHYMSEFGVYEKYNSVNALSATFTIGLDSISNVADSIITKIMPEHIYVTAFINLSAPKDPYTLAINNLCDAEYNYLISLTSTTDENGNTSSSIADTISSSIDSIFIEPLTLNIAADFSLTISLTDLIELSTISHATYTDILPAYGALTFTQNLLTV